MLTGATATVTAFMAIAYAIKALVAQTASLAASIANAAIAANNVPIANQVTMC